MQKTANSVITFPCHCVHEWNLKTKKILCIEADWQFEIPTVDDMSLGFSQYLSTSSTLNIVYPIAVCVSCRLVRESSTQIGGSLLSQRSCSTSGPVNSFYTSVLVSCGTSKHHRYEQCDHLQQPVLRGAGPSLNSTCKCSILKYPFLYLNLVYLAFLFGVLESIFTQALYSTSDARLYLI